MKKQRILSALLALCLVFSLMPTALAAGADGFTDVGKDSWCYEYVDYVTSEGYFLGTTDTTFSPNRNMTRAMFVVVLARFDGVKVDNSRSSFTDVEPGAWCAGAVEWAAENGIVTGYADSTFKPNASITRAQMCAIMDRYVDYYTAKHNVVVAQKGKAANLADQGQVPSYATKAVKNCQIYGLIYGYEDGTFRPQANSTRAHVAAIIYRLAFLIDGAKDANLYMVCPNCGALLRKGGKCDECGYSDKKPSTGRPGGSGGGGDTRTYTYTLTYDANGGVFPAGTKTTVDVTGTSGTFTVTIPGMAQPVKTGYTFKGWSTNPNGPVQTRISVSGNTTLYAVWDAEPVPAGSYTITYVLNYEGAPELAPAYTESTTAAAKAFTTLGSQTREGYVFTGWNTAANGSGDPYAANWEYTATGDMTLYAQWISDKDYIGIAVKNTMEQLNADYISKAQLTYGENKAALVPLTFSGSETDDNTVSRPQTAAASVAVTDDIVAQVVEYASLVACSLVDVTRDDLPSKDEVNDTIQSIIDAVEEATGITIKDQTAQQIKNQVYELLKQEGKGLWENFYDASGDYYTGGIEIVAGNYKVTVQVDQANHSTTLSDPSKRNAVTRIATEVARELFADLKAQAAGKYVDTATIEAIVDVTFSDNDDSGYGAATANYPHEYPVTLSLELDGGGLVMYKFENNENYLKLCVTEAIQTAYEDGVEALAESVVNSDRLRNILEPIVEETLEKDNTYSELVKKLRENYGIELDISETDVKAALTAQTDNWLDANLGIFYDYLWVKGESIEDMDIAALCDNSMLADAIWGQIEDQFTEENMGEWLRTMIVEELDKANIDIVEMANENSTVKSAREMLADFTDVTFNPSNFSLDIASTEDINALMDCGIVEFSGLYNGQIPMKAYVGGTKPDGTPVNFGEVIRDIILDEAAKALDERFADSSHAELYNKLIANDETVKNYLIYSALVEMGLDFDAEKAAVEDAAQAKLSGIVASFAEDYITEKIGDKVETSIREATGEGGRLAGYVTYLTKAQNIKTYDGLARAKFSNLATLLESDQLANLIGSKGDSYVQDYLAKVIGKIPAGASVTVNGVLVNKDALDDLAAAKTTVAACEALAAIIGDFGELSISSFGEPGIPVKITYNNRNFEFNLVIADE